MGWPHGAEASPPTPRLEPSYTRLTALPEISESRLWWPSGRYGGVEWSSFEGRVLGTMHARAGAAPEMYPRCTRDVQSPRRTFAADMAPLPY